MVLLLKENLTSSLTKIHIKAELTQQHKNTTVSGTWDNLEEKLCHKTSFNKFKETEITQSIFSDHNEIKLENSIRKIHM